MEKSGKDLVSMGTKVGAVLGAIAFLFFGLGWLIGYIVGTLLEGKTVEEKQ